MRSRMVAIAVLALGALLAGGAPIFSQAGPCPPAGEPPVGGIRVTIGHFAEGADDVAEFCRYLVGHEIWPAFRSLGSAKDPNAGRRAAEALEAGTIDVLWLSSYATGTVLATNPALRLKVAAVTDLITLHVGSRTPAAALVTDAGFAPAEIAVRQGRSMFFADALMIATRRRPRCLEAPIGCTAYPGEGLRAGLDAFLAARPGRATVLASWAFPPKGPDVVVRRLYDGPGFHLVGVPAPTVVAMQPVSGMMALVQIPKAAYGPAQQAEVPTGAVAQWLVSSTPPEVAGRVRQLIGKINKGLLETDPRVNLGQELPIALGLVGKLGDSLQQRLFLHPEFARLLTGLGIERRDDRPRGPGNRGG